MKKITEEDIDKALAKLEHAQSNPFDKLFEAMDQEQPALVDYLYELEGDELNEDERGMLINVAVISWHIIKETVGVDTRVTDDQIDAQLEKNCSLLDERKEKIQEIDEDFINLFAKFNKQPELMSFIVSLIADRPSEYDGNLREDMIAMISLHIKTLVDCLILAPKA